MDHPVQPTPKRFRQIYELGFQTWADLYSKAIDNPSLPESCFDPFPQHPRFPPNLKLKHVQYAKHSSVYATGSSTWESPQDDCPYGLPAFQQQFQLPVGVRKPMSLSAADDPEGNPGYASWFSSGDVSHFPALVLAWAYILSASWPDVVPGACCLAYTGSLEPSDDKCGSPPQAHGDALVVDIGDADVEEARWWAAVLAPGEGWQVRMLVEGDGFLSSWSVSLQAPHPFLLSGKWASHLARSTCAAASSSAARRWLYKFCVRHHILDQSHAALLAVALLPSLASGKAIRLPAFKAGNPTWPASQAASGPLEYQWPYHDAPQLDRLLTLSCNTRGISPLLLSVFYEPSIE